MADNYTTVDAVIIATCLKMGGENPLRKYAQLYAHARSWFTADYNAESGQTLKTVLLDVGPDRVAELPGDYLDWVLVGRQAGDQIRLLAHNPQRSPLAPVAVPTAVASFDASPESWWPCYSFAGWPGGTLFGYGWGEYREDFSVDAPGGTLRLSSAVTPDQPLYFQYISSDLQPGKPTPLHPAYALALEYWMLWQLHLRKNELAPAGNYERLYLGARKKARAQLSPFSLASLEAILRASYNQVR